MEGYPDRNWKTTRSVPTHHSLGFGNDTVRVEKRDFISSGDLTLPLNSDLWDVPRPNLG